MKKTLLKLYEKTRQPFKKIILFLKQKLGWLDIPQILPYRGFGNDKVIYLKGRVLEHKGLSMPEEEDSIWDNILAMVKRYSSDELPGLHVKATFQGEEHIAVTDETGKFEFILYPKQKLDPDISWHQVKLELIDEVRPDQGRIEAIGEFMVPSKRSKFGIISDVDDTFLISHSTALFKKLWLMLLKNAYTRMPFEGVGAFYRSLSHGQNRKYRNPIFYVSSSEWNLYDMLTQFCFYHNIPKGPFLLKSYRSGIQELFSSEQGKHEHKLEKIRHILTTFKDLNFILIGDSTQRDAEIYGHIAKEFPDRIKAIYIRDVRKSRHKSVTAIAEDLKDHYGIEMLLVKDTLEAAYHALRMEYISSDDIQSIDVERFKDKHSSTEFSTIKHKFERKHAEFG